MPIVETLKEKFAGIVRDNGLLDETVRIKLGTLTPRQAIGDPARKDFALLEGREVMIEAEFRGSYGQAFTDVPQAFDGTLGDILSLGLHSGHERALFIASLNAVMASLNSLTATRHCRDEGPEKCAGEIAGYLMKTYGPVRIGQIGFQPAILAHLVQVFGQDNVVCTDLAVNNVGARKSGIEIWDGRTHTEELVRRSDTVLATSSTIANGSYDSIAATCERLGRRLIIFGVTGAGAAALCDLELVCFEGK